MFFGNCVEFVEYGFDFGFRYGFKCGYGVFEFLYIMWVEKFEYFSSMVFV